MNPHKVAYSIPWNLFLITMGSILTGVGLKAIVIPNGMITGGFSGLGILIYYGTHLLTPGIWYLLLNVPVFIAGWLFVSRRFLLYSLYGTVVLTIAIDAIRFTLPVDDFILAAMAGGTVVGAGAGMVFRSLGSCGGNDIISVILNNKFGFRIGTYNFMFNLILFLFSFGTLETELILYSVATSYITSQMIDYCMTLFNQRRMILIISRAHRQIADEIMNRLKRGATFIHGEGGFTGQEKKIILTVVNPLQIKRVEEIVFMIDPDAFLITENTFNVLGKGFSKPKVY